MSNEKEKPIILWKDAKFLIGVVLVIVSFILGIYGKGLLGVYMTKVVLKIYEPFYLITGLSVYAVSFLLLFLGIFLVGWETVKMIQYRIRHHVKKTVRSTYHYTKGLPRKGYEYTKELHKKSMDKIKKSMSKNG